VFSFLRKTKSRKVLIIGLDCAEPTLVFDQWRNELPTFRHLMGTGAYGLLTSSIPCITVPAWSSILSSKDPGTLGFYGFQNRADYRKVRNIPSDLLIYFGNLHWRSVGSLGHKNIYTFENDTDPDDANHAQEGMIIYYDPKHHLNGKRLRNLQLIDIAPTVLQLMGQPVPENMQGKVISV
jgi:predicted AlkP superfamily phosphohydrolase/phosphomutase